MQKQDLITRLALNNTFMEIFTISGLFISCVGFAFIGTSIF